MCKHILRPFSDRFWDEGCPAPTITGFKAHIDLKPDAKLQLRQPYRLSKFDETRLRFLYEEAEREGKVERYTLGERPPCVCTPVIVVDKKGSLIGRKVGDFRSFNLLTMDYYYPAPDADMVLMEACGKRFHSLFDCVWGFEQIDLDDSTAELCSTITPFGVFKSKKLPMGVKQGPGIYQHMQDNAFQCEYKESGEKLCNAFFDDTHIGDFELTEHIQSVTRVLTIARRYNIQYRLSKCEFFKPEVLLLGFLCSAEGRKADPRKIEQLKAWPEYTSVADINSHLAFANYLREYLGPDYSERVKPLRAYQKKGANFADFAEDKVAQEARLWLKSIILENCVLVLPDFVAASRPWHSGRPFEAFLDASDESWCVALCQRSEPAGCPRIIAFICKSFTDEATRWSAFEREYYCFKEGYAAISKYVTGFTLFMYFDHKNIERAESVLTSRRASKKLVNWIADTQHILANVVRLWIDGKNNILADCGSRLPWHTSVSKHLPVPAGPIRDVIRLLFTHPHELEKLVQGKANEMGLGAWQPALPTDASSIDPERSTAHEGPRSEVSRPTPSRQSESLGRPGHSRSGPAGGRDAIPEDIPVPDGFTEASEEFLDVQSSYSWQELPVPQTPDSSDDWIDVPVPSSSGSEGSTTVPGAPISSASSSVAVGRSTGDQVNSSRISRVEFRRILVRGERGCLRPGTRAYTGKGSQSELIYRGTRFTGMAHHKHLLEVCSGTAKLTWTAAAAGCDVMDPVDKNTGWDLTTRGDLRSLMRLVRQFRPFVTHIAPVCRSFSVAYHPQPGSGKDGSIADQLDLQLALNLASVAKLVVALGLYVVIENPVGSRLFKLQEYQHLHSMTGFFFVRVNSCMLGVTHPVTGKPVWKGYQIPDQRPLA